MPNGKLIVTRFRAVPFILAALYVLEIGLALALPDGAEVVTQLVCTCPALCLLVCWAGAPLGYCTAWRVECFLPCLPDIAFIANHYGLYTKPHLWMAATAVLLIGSIVNGIIVYAKR